MNLFKKQKVVFLSAILLINNLKSPSDDEWDILYRPEELKTNATIIDLSGSDTCSVVSIKSLEVVTAEEYIKKIKLDVIDYFCNKLCLTSIDNNLILIEIKEAFNQGSISKNQAFAISLASQLIALKKDNKKNFTHKEVLIIFSYLRKICLSFLCHFFNLNRSAKQTVFLVKINWQSFVKELHAESLSKYTVNSKKRVSFRDVKFIENFKKIEEYPVSNQINLMTEGSLGKLIRFIEAKNK